MKWKSASFDQLSTQELYQILKLRVDIFVVEQECPYEELDGKDKDAIHVMGYEHNELVAYARLFGPGVYYTAAAAIGRVAVKKKYRGQQLGNAIMTESYKLLKSLHGNVAVQLAAQQYLEDFYARLGFEVISEPYDWDGIVHVDMRIDKIP